LVQGWLWSTRSPQGKHCWPEGPMTNDISDDYSFGVWLKSTTLLLTCQSCVLDHPLIILAFFIMT
jgi:hypothetical protein